MLRWRKILPGQVYHIYLMAHGVFRFFHEYLRATPDVFGPFSGYQIGALCVFLLGLAGFLKRIRNKLPHSADDGLMGGFWVFLAFKRASTPGYPPACTRV